MEQITSSGEKRKCAYEQCSCLVSYPHEYCSDLCSDADDVAEGDLQRSCEHAACARD